MSRAEESKGEGKEKGGGWWKSGGNYIKPCGGGGRWSGWFESGAEEGKDGTRAKERRRKVLAPPMRERECFKNQNGFHFYLSSKPSISLCARIF